MSIIKQLENTKSNLQSMMVLITGKVVSYSILKKYLFLRIFYALKFQNRTLEIIVDAVTWLKYCRYGLQHYPINQSINSSINQSMERLDCLIILQYTKCICSYSVNNFISNLHVHTQVNMFTLS